MQPAEIPDPEVDRGPQRVPTGVARGDLAGRARLVDTPLGKLALVLDRGTVVAIDAWCPHLDGPLWEGSASRGEVACPWHGWRYSLTTGRCTWAPRGDAEEAAETEIRVLATETDPDGQIFVLDVDRGGEPSPNDGENAGKGADEDPIDRQPGP